MLAAVLLVAVSGCAYLGTVTKEKYYGIRQKIAPRQRVNKHMVERSTVFVYGQIQGLRAADHGKGIAVAAITADASQAEVVDVHGGARGDSYYALNLPDGEFRLIVLCDRDGDGVARREEAIAETRVSVRRTTTSDGVMDALDLDLGALGAPAMDRLGPVAVKLPAATSRAESLFYPKGTLRTLDDPIFDPGFATLGLYAPATFMERAPMLFYALEEDCGYKVPVIFVHGIDGSARQFAPMVAALDRRRYQPWFFHYPSGTDLSQLSSIFYRIFLSGRVIPRPDMPMVIVAHSMGGLVVRDALSRMTGGPRENIVASLITISSPLGGHPGARASQRAPVVIPSWADLDPESEFIARLHRRPLPTGCAYTLFYTFARTDPEDLAHATDGVVPLGSQLERRSVAESKARRGYADGHLDVLSDPRVIADVMERIQRVHSVFPEDHLRLLDAGGYDVPLGPEFSPLEAHLVRTIGRYMDALVAGEIEAFHPEQVAFVRACRGEIRPSNPAASAWVKLHRKYGPVLGAAEADAPAEASGMR